MSLQETILADLKASMKARDQVAKETLRMLRSELSSKELELGRPLEEKDELAVLTSAVKMRRDAIGEYEKAGREDLVSEEKKQIEVIERYLPEPMDEDEARRAIGELATELGVSEKRQMGQLMKVVMERYRGRIDGKLASRIAAQLLA